jgi:hypothetical protein
MPHAKRSTALWGWLISLINPPPLKAMTQLQKVARVLLFTMALIVICIITSMLAAVGLFLLQHVHRMFTNHAETIGDIGIIFISMLINALCVMVLLKIKHADQKLIPPEGPTPTAKPE